MKQPGNDQVDALLKKLAADSKSQTINASVKSPDSLISKNKGDAQSQSTLPPLKDKKDQETEILSLIKKNLLFDKPKKKYAKGEFAKEYVTIDKSSNGGKPSGRFHNSGLMAELEIKASKKDKDSEKQEKLMPIETFKKPLS